MSIPQITLRYSYPYAKMLYRGNEDFETVWQRIVERSSAFEEWYIEVIDRLLELIPQYSGYDWEEYADPLIPVYIADIPISFANPLTLRTDEDSIRMLASLLHELTHCNMAFGFPNAEARESAYFAVSRAVAGGLSADFLAAVKSIEADVKSSASLTYEDRPWDLAKKTAKKYLTSNS